MIEKMHDRTNGPVFKIIFALVSLSFVLGGIGGSLSSGDPNFAVKVNGESVQQTEFNNLKNIEQNQLNAELGPKFWDLLDDPTYAKNFNQKVMDKLIDQQLYQQYLHTLKLNVSVDQIKREIVSLPYLQVDGKFSDDVYKMMLTNNAMSADQFASIVANGILSSQLEDGIINSHFTTPAQQSLLAKYLLQQRKVAMATLSLAQATEKQQASAEEISNYYNAHKQNFVEPEKFEVEFVTVTPQDVANNTEISEQQIDEYYQQNKAHFVVAAENRLAHIQVASEAEANALAQALQNGADFAQLAQEKSTDGVSAKAGGDLGWSKAGTFPPAFELAANETAVGAVSKPVNVDGSYHLIKVLERKPAHEIGLEQAKAEIINQLRQNTMLSDYSKLTNAMANKAFESRDALAPVAELAKLPVKKTAAFTRKAIPAEINYEKVLEALFANNFRSSGEVSEAIDASDDHTPRTLFIRVSNYQAERTKSLDEAKAEVELAVKRQKAEQALLKQGEEMVAALNRGESTSVPFEPEQVLVYLDSYIKEPALTADVFAMPKPTDGSLYKMARNDNGDVVIVALDDVIDGTAAEFAPIAAQFENAQKDKLRTDMVRDLRARASIEYNEEFLNQINPAE